MPMNENQRIKFWFLKHDILMKINPQRMNHGKNTWNIRWFNSVYPLLRQSLSSSETIMTIETKQIEARMVL